MNDFSVVNAVQKFGINGTSDNAERGVLFLITLFLVQEIFKVLYVNRAGNHSLDTQWLFL